MKEKFAEHYNFQPYITHSNLLVMIVMIVMIVMSS